MSRHTDAILAHGYELHVDCVHSGLGPICNYVETVRLPRGGELAIGDVYRSGSPENVRLDCVHAVRVRLLHAIDAVLA